MVESTGSEHSPRVDESAVDVAGYIMRVRRLCDLSQRELGAVLGLEQSQVARMESSQRRVDVPLLSEILSLAGLRIAVVDEDGMEVAPVPHDVLRDNADRRMPAHLDVRPKSDPPRSTLVDTHPGRAVPRAWYHHRTKRDRRRAGRDARSIPDQPTSRSIANAERERRRTRRRAVQERIAMLDTEGVMGGVASAAPSLSDKQAR
ncbi:MAG TPA: helix-turn-helix transcriptional regulator [Agromyces sp.]|nr:helix-turn-helix transcriptional regulator [Agromyces sp.]